MTKKTAKKINDQRPDKILPPKSDIVFKLLFGDERELNLLTALLKAVLDLPEDDYDQVTIADPNLQREFENDKLAILDVKVKTKSGRVINVEIQITDTDEMKERIIYNMSKMVTEQIGMGDDYDKIRQVVAIVVADFKLIEDSEPYHHHYFFYDKKNDSKFTDLMEAHTLELRKLPPESDQTKLYEWLRFLRTERREELEMLPRNNPDINKAVGRLLELSADEKTRMLYEVREKARRDEAAKIKTAHRKGKAEGIAEGITKGIAEGITKGEAKERIGIAKNLLGMNLAPADIAKATGLPLEEIKKLRQ